MMHRLLVGAAAIVLGAAACQTVQPKSAGTSPKEQLDAAEHRAEASGSAADQGSAALAAYVLTGNPERSKAWADKALAQDPNEAAALYVHVLIAREALDEAGVVRWALAIVHNAPKSQFAELALLRLYEISQVSPSLDRMLLDGLGDLDTVSLRLEGRVALRAREVLAAVRDGMNDDDGSDRAHAALATPSAWTVVGPLEPLRLSGFSQPSPFDDPHHVIEATYHRPTGDITPRVIPTPAGSLDLNDDLWRADVYEALVDFDAKRGGSYMVSLRGVTEVSVFVDGVQITRRSSYPIRAPERTWGGVMVPPGSHRLRVRFARVDASWVSVALGRADGDPSDLAFHAPAPGSQPPPVAATRLSGAGDVSASDAHDCPAVAMYLRLQNELATDSEQARAELPGLVTAAGENPAIRALRAELTASDPDVPRGTIISRVTQDLEAILADQPDDARALAARFEQERGDKRFDEASHRLQHLESVLGQAHPRLWMLKAHLSLDRGDGASARRFAEAALRLDPGRCEAVEYRLGLARRATEEGNIASLTPQLMTCPGGVSTNADFLRLRMKLPEAKVLLERLVKRSPTSLGPRRALSDTLFAMGDVEHAIAATEPWDVFWPQRTDALKRLSMIYELIGDTQGAEKMVKRSLALDQSDLTAARALAIGTKNDVMSWADTDGLSAIAEFKKAHFETTAGAVQVLDLGAAQIETDGSMTELTHSVVQVLDKKAIDQYGELTLPGDAQALAIRTVKADGTILEAEAIAGKESISLPNLEPGDFVEYDYLKSSGARPPSVHGWQGGQFFFQGEDAPFFESTYRVRAPASIGMELDTSNLPEPASVVKDGDYLTMTYTRRRMAPFLREPNAPSDAEILPWLEVGAGATTPDMLKQFGDALAPKMRVTGEAIDFTREIAKLPVAERPKAIVDKLRDEVRSDTSTADFSESGASVLAQSRGNRMLALKVALAAVGIPSHIVLARNYTYDPHDFRFLHLELYSAPLLRIEVPGIAPMWMDFGLRLAPLNRIPPALSEADAYAIPEPGEPPEHIKLPKVDSHLDRTDADLNLALDASGTLTGTITQHAYGFDAAGVRRRLEQIDKAQLHRQMERGLDATFNGVVLTDYKIDDSGDPDQPLMAVATIRVPHFGERDDGTTALAANFGAAQMGPRYLTQERQMPLLMGIEDFSQLHAVVALPLAMTAKVPPPVAVNTPYGTYSALWRQEKNVLHFDEEIVMRRGRIPTGEYRAFESFASAIDGAQKREIPLSGHASL